MPTDCIDEVQVLRVKSKLSILNSLGDEPSAIKPVNLDFLPN